MADDPEAETTRDMETALPESEEEALQIVEAFLGISVHSTMISDLDGGSGRDH